MTIQMNADETNIFDDYVEEEHFPAYRGVEFIDHLRSIGIDTTGYLGSSGSDEVCAKVHECAQYFFDWVARDGGGYGSN